MGEEMDTPVAIPCIVSFCNSKHHLLPFSATSSPASFRSQLRCCASFLFSVYLLAARDFDGSRFSRWIAIVFVPPFVWILAIHPEQ